MTHINHEASVYKLAINCGHQKENKTKIKVSHADSCIFIPSRERREAAFKIEQNVIYKLQYLFGCSKIGLGHGHRHTDNIRAIMLWAYKIRKSQRIRKQWHDWQHWEGPHENQANIYVDAFEVHSQHVYVCVCVCAAEKMVWHWVTKTGRRSVEYIYRGFI